jgi:hypothetical protein
MAPAREMLADYLIIEGQILAIGVPRVRPAALDRR